MKALLLSREFGGELTGWTLRGALAASIAAGWAIKGGFTRPMEIAGMIAGLLGWVIVFATFSGWGVRMGEKAPVLAVGALKRAVWVKLACSLTCGVIFIGDRATSRAGDWLLNGGFIDLYFGIVSLAVVSLLAGVSLEQVTHLDTFGYTALATLLHGALTTGAIAAIAATLFGWRWFGREVRGDAQAQRILN